ncbi:hypothetical protein D3C71_1669710 [compost metagenome]
MIGANDANFIQRSIEFTVLDAYGNGKGLADKAEGGISSKLCSHALQAIGIVIGKGRSGGYFSRQVAQYRFGPELHEYYLFLLQHVRHVVCPTDRFGKLSYQIVYN